MVEFTPEFVGAVVGVFLSVLFRWFPGISSWFAQLKSDIKSVIMLFLVALASVTIYLLAYYGVISTPEPITVWQLVKVFFAVLMMNQATYLIQPEDKRGKHID